MRAERASGLTTSLTSMRTRGVLLPGEAMDTVHRSLLRVKFLLISTRRGAAAPLHPPPEHRRSPTPPCKLGDKTAQILKLAKLRRFAVSGVFGSNFDVFELKR